MTIFLSTKTEAFFLFPKICLAVYIANFVLSLAFKARHSGKLRYSLSPRRCNLAVTYLLLFFSSFFFVTESLFVNQAGLKSPIFWSQLTGKPIFGQTLLYHSHFYVAKIWLSKYQGEMKNRICNQQDSNIASVPW